MSDIPIKDCHAEFNQAMPQKPWNKASAEQFFPLRDLIAKHTQSDLFVRRNKYAGTEDYFDFAQDLADQGKSVGKETLPNGVTAEFHLDNGKPFELILEDPAASLKETVTLNKKTGVLEDDKTEYCGVSRERKFANYIQYYEGYTFPGGSLTETKGSGAPQLPVLKFDGQK